MCLRVQDVLLEPNKSLGGVKGLTKVGEDRERSTWDIYGDLGVWFFRVNPQNLDTSPKKSFYKCFRRCHCERGKKKERGNLEGKSGNLISLPYFLTVIDRPY